jgi:hypothetical protein
MMSIPLASGGTEAKAVQVYSNQSLLLASTIHLLQELRSVYIWGFCTSDQADCQFVTASSVTTHTTFENRDDT